MLAQEERNTQMFASLKRSTTTMRSLHFSIFNANLVQLRSFQCNFTAVRMQLHVIATHAVIWSFIGYYWTNLSEPIYISVTALTRRLTFGAAFFGLGSGLGGAGFCKW